MNRIEIVEILTRSYQKYYNLSLYKEKVTEEERQQAEEADLILYSDASGRERRPNPVYREPITSLPLYGMGEYYETAQQYLLHRKAEVWSANSEEFLFMFSTERLTEDLCREIERFVIEEGNRIAHIGRGHMYTYITPIIICDTITPEAEKFVKKCNYYKNFKFAFHGWMELHLAVIEAEKDRIISNGRGKCVEKTLKRVLIHKMNFADKKYFFKE